ncbi:DNA gyrase/topoisomerase IV, A subunit [Ancylostoma caninum]|uniref:DNA topoisomerase 2 n=1 Tax=Ancylostoma caninum TaxID=29170 RepID=A0A368G6C5_ANCCA|nr:DNA gyrase/topoisomerase IV, A subunit [Ancylostoma caninum]
MSDSDDSDFFVDESPKKKAPAKKPAGEKKAPAKPKEPKEPKEKKEKIADISMTMTEEDKNVFTNIDQASKAGKKLAIEDIYQKKSQLEHILLRPDTYIGSVEYTEKTPMWIYDLETEKLVMKDIQYVPGLYKIFDEILVNAADNKQRDPKMNCIKINIDKEKNQISIYNNGKGIPVVHHKVENMYVPEMIFGTLLTSSNYDDSQRKVTGGRNGYGAKLCNIFSTEFTLETSSREYGKAFKQTWINNMIKDKDCQIVKAAGEDYTKITFKPDLTKFKMKELDDDIVGLMCRRAYDVAGSTKGVKVLLNGKVLPVQGFKQYVEQYTKDLTGPTGEPIKVVYESVNERWEVALTVSEKGFQQVSFVNSIATTKGGRHVDYVADQMVSKLIDVIKKKVGKSTVNVKPFQVKNHMWVFVNCLIENPTFDSQTKETMTLQAKSFGSKCELSEKFSKQAINCGVVDAVLAWVRFKQQEDMNKKCSGKKATKLKGIPKLEDANDAGTKNSQLCTLILTEGDSAKTLAVSGLGVVGRDRYGVFPLRGKLLNVREGNIKQVAENAEINALIKIIGLQYKKKYETEEDFKSLRYGKVMVMADQDQDGSHIKGLVINFIHHNWPSLIQRNFVEEFITPIVKATKGKDELSFFSIPEYNEWRNNTENWKTYKIKYYKGLGTSTSKEAKEYFSDMVRHRIRFKYGGAEDDNAVDMAFSKKKIEERKDWLTKWMAEKKERRTRGLEEEYLYNKDTRAVTFSDFVNKELVLFSNTDNERSIPSLVDGFKPGQRKVLFACFKRADKREVKVAQLAGAVGELSAYHHGEASLMGTIINLAQDFVGSNNVNLLLPIGQFGTRLQGGKDSASPRYIFTQLNPVARTIFPVPDDHVLRFLFEENQRIEPEWYCPIIPMVLVNGASGIGTGWSTSIHNYNPREICENMRKLIRGEQPKPMAPWFKGFRGTIEQLDPSRYVCSGEVAVLSDDTIEITELPIKTWTQTYKESVLEPMLESSDKKTPIISDFKEYHTDTTVRFVIKVANGKLKELEAEGLHKVFKLQTVLNTTSMVLFDASGCLRKFNTPEEICAEFFETRKQKYIERKAFMEGMLRAQSNRLTNQARFILAKIKGEIVMENKKKAAIVDQLIKKGFDPDPVKKWKEIQKKKELEQSGEYDATEEEEQEEEGGSGDQELEGKLSDYDYLVGMALIKLSEEEKNKLLKESDDKLRELRDLEAKSWADLWNADLDTFLEALAKQEAKEKADQDVSIKNAMKKFSKDEKPKGKKAAAFAAEVFPSKDGIRVEPGIDKAMKEKYDKIKAAATREKKPKVPKEPKEPKKPKKEGGDIKKFMSDEKKSPKKKKKRDEWDSDASSSEFSDNDDPEESALFDDDEDVEEIIPKKDRASRGAPKRYSDADDSVENGHAGEGDAGGDVVTIDDDSPVKAEPKKTASKRKVVESDGSFDGETSPKKAKKAESKKPAAKKTVDGAGDEPAPKKAKKVQKPADDSIFEIPDDEDEDSPPRKKAPAKKAESNGAGPAKRAAKGKAKKENGTSDSPKMTDFFGKKGKGKKKGGGSDSEDDIVIEDDEPVAPRQTSRRQVARPKYDYGGTDDEDEDDSPKPKKKKVIDSDSE